MENTNKSQRYCLACGKEVIQLPKTKPKKFCCDKCRITYWHIKRKNDTEHRLEDSYICKHCGKKFFAYCAKDRKYCSHECYISDRYGTANKGKGTDSEGQKHDIEPENHSIHEGGYDIDDVNSQNSIERNADEQKQKKEINDSDIISYSSNPFVSFADHAKIELSADFYNAAVAFSEMEIQALLLIFEVNPSNFNREELAVIKELLAQWQQKDTVADYDLSSDTVLKIRFNMMAAMDRLVEEKFLKIGQKTKTMSFKERKLLCLMIKDFPKDPGGIYTISHILELVGISRNSYYRYIKDERYGLSVDERDKLDEKYVRLAFEYKGYKKGVRMVYMLIPKLSGKKIGIDRVRRIMRKYGMNSGVRQANSSRKAAAKMLETYGKPNLLRRMFRLYKPNEVRLTDVTYLKYGEGLKAYGSALIDPVTGMLIAFIVSESNDIELAKETLRRMDRHPCINGGILHSDQGSVYLSPKFQKEVEKLGLNQSMSKRGNCWDNAPQESFFGHFKDECDYSECKNIDELRQVIEEYAYYYNNERGMWERRHMTPVKYEEYLLSMTDEEFEKHLDREKEKYHEMQQIAAEKAKARYRTLGV